VEANLRLVVSSPRSIQQRFGTWLSLHPGGKLGLIARADKFQVSLGYKFSTYAPGGSSRDHACHFRPVPHHPYPGAHEREHEQIPAALLWS